ncbi:MAG TPA: hypothetical protein VHS05_14340 [Pyrinomonadaceae bacterium]|jgi:hypothetical protein|nr:hypothetical protein [Pyrinomonadaceae bacterium]
MDRISAITNSNSVVVTVKAQKKWGLILFLPVWLTFWTFGGITVLTLLITGSDRNPFLFIWLCGWAVGETLALLILSWTLVGREVITIERGVFSHRREIFGFGVTRTYAMHELFNLRASGFFGNAGSFSGSFARYGLSGGTVAVDTRYGEPYRFGINLEEDDARVLANILEPYFRRNTAQQS